MRAPSGPERLASQGKLLPRQRLQRLLDPGTPFLELSTLAANMSYGGESPGASCITGIAIVCGREVMVHADDPTVKGGAWYPLTIKKIVRALDLAIENQLPVVHLCGFWGGQLQLQSQLFSDRKHWPADIPNQSVLSKMGVKQLAIVFGHCTRGRLRSGAERLQRDRPRYRRGVPMGRHRKAATGELVSADDLGGCDLHTRISGTATTRQPTRMERLACGRTSLRSGGGSRRAAPEQSSGAAADPDELYG